MPVPPDNIQSVRLYVTLDKQGTRALAEQATTFDIVITDIASGEETAHEATFQGPPR